MTALAWAPRERAKPVGSALYPEVIAQPHTTSEDGDFGLQGMILGGGAFDSADPRYEDDPEFISELNTDDGEQLGFDVICPSWAMIGECPNYHRIAKSLYCNRQWCQGDCGGVDGPAHNRRKASWLPKAQQIGMMSRDVLTIPPEIRDRYRTKKTLGELGTAAKRMYQRHGHKRGLRAWHYFGEDHPGQGLQGDDDIRPYHPHLEVITDGGFLPLACLDEDEVTGSGCLGPGDCLAGLKRSWANILKVPYERVNIYHEYVQAWDVRTKLHRINYALRPTFLDWRWDEDLAGELQGFCSNRTWGKWDGPVLWDVPMDRDKPAPSPELVALAKGHCPTCDKPIKWIGIMKAAFLKVPESEWKGLDDGYYINDG